MTVLTHKGGEYASQLFGCIVCNTATTGYDCPKRCVVFVYLKLSHTICWVLLTLYSFQYSLSEMDLFLFPFLGMLIILFLYLSVASLLSLVYVFVSPTMLVIFSLYILLRFVFVRGDFFDLGVMAKFKPLLSIDHSSSLICLSLRFITHLFVSMSVSVTSFLV